MALLTTVNVELKKNENETKVTSIIQEVLGDDEDYWTWISKIVRIGRPVLQESQKKAVDTLGGAAIVVDDNNGQGISNNIRPMRRTYRDADQKKTIPSTLR